MGKMQKQSEGAQQVNNTLYYYPRKIIRSAIDMANNREEPARNTDCTIIHVK